MDNSKNINKQCMEKILQHLTKLITLTEFGEVKELSKLIDMSTSISAQLIAIEENNSECHAVFEFEDEEENINE